MLRVATPSRAARKAVCVAGGIVVAVTAFRCHELADSRAKQADLAAGRADVIAARNMAELKALPSAMEIGAPFGKADGLNAKQVEWVTFSKAPIVGKRGYDERRGRHISHPAAGARREVLEGARLAARIRRHGRRRVSGPRRGAVAGSTGGEAGNATANQNRPHFSAARPAWAGYASARPRTLSQARRRVRGIHRAPDAECGTQE
jgi:hypothetical protein